MIVYTATAQIDTSRKLWTRAGDRAAGGRKVDFGSWSDYEA